VTSSASRPLWTCPKCGNTFVSRNIYHACGQYHLADHFDGKPPIVRRTFDAWLEAARACGLVRVTTQKTRIVFQVRVRFAGAIIRSRTVDAHIWLTQKASHPALLRIETLTPNAHIHRFRLARPEDIDDALRALVREAYSVGKQEHLKRT
jgi:Domain of unknown function (DUF5655)